MKKKNVTLALIVVAFLSATAWLAFGDAQGGATVGPIDSGKITVVQGAAAGIAGQIVNTGTSFKFYLTGTSGINLSGTNATAF